MATLVDRIARLEREEWDAMARLRTSAPGRLAPYKTTDGYLEYVRAQLVSLRRRKLQRARAASAVSQQAPARVWRRPSPRPADEQALRPAHSEPEGRPVIVAGVEYLAIWPLPSDPKAPPTALNREASR